MNRRTRDGNAVTQSRQPNRSAAEPRAWWQKMLAGEPVPKGLFKSKCDGTVEHQREIALDVRELIRKRVFDRPVGSVFSLQLRFPWLRVVRLSSSSFELQLVTGRVVTVPLVWASCGVIGQRMRLECPLCSRRVCRLYHLHGRVACRICNSLWYAAQRTSGSGRKYLTMRKIRRKLGDYGRVSSAKLPPKPRGMWRRTYARHCAALIRIERRLFSS
jgi:hypothetical protein